MKQLLLLLLACLIQAPSFAQTSVSIKGRLIAEGDETPLPYATISVTQKIAPGGTAFRRISTDDKGNFSLPLPAGEYVFTFAFVGMETLSRDVDVAPGSKSIDLGKIAMTESSTELQEVSVVAQKPLVKVEIDKLTYNAKDDPESSTSNVLDLLRKVPLVSVDADDNIQLKGSSNFKIYLNGKPSNMLASNPSQVLKSMPANSIKNVEVITDPGARYDAEGIGGIINIVTDKRADDGYTGSVSAGVDSRGGYNASAYLTLKYGKLGFTGNASRYTSRSPFADSKLTRDDFAPNPINNLSQTGRSKSFNDGGYGSAMVSYEPDTLNLFSLSVNHNGGGWNSRSEQSTVSKGSRDYTYLLNIKNKGDYGGTDLSVDYQRSFSKKDELLTLSYRFGRNPNDSEGETAISDVTGASPYSEDYWQRSTNDASGKEHTGQVDYVNPLTKKHSIEVGLKYISRDNSGDSKWLLWDSASQTWQADDSRRNDLDHRQHIASGYASYGFKSGKFGAKLGVRGEYTNQNAKFKTVRDTTINKTYIDVVPSAILSYQLGMTRTLRLGYNMRIYRPGIWYLNPYINDTNPLNISYGNPGLEAEKNHNFSLNYGSFSTKLNLNLSLNYSLTNNAITSYQFVKDGITNSTYDNIGKDQTVGINTYLNWSPVTQFRVYLSGSIDYSDIRSNNGASLRNNGFSGRAFSGATYTFPKDLRVSLNAGIFGSGVELQSSQSAFYFTSIRVMKSFLDKKLDVSVGANSPFWKYIKIKSTINGEGFLQKSEHNSLRQSFSLNVTWRFGDLKSSVKRVQRGISNDDVKSGGGSGEGGGSESGS